jgi:hypothetical protein
MTLNVPTPEVAGSKVPAAPLVIPVPVQTPPACAALKLNAAALAQTGPCGVIVAFACIFTVTVDVLLEGQAPPIEYVMVKLPAPDVAGLKVPVAALVIPVPLHVPPPVAALMLNAVAPEQTGATAVIVVLGKAFTVTVDVLLEGQAPPIEYVIVKLPAPETEGSNVPFAALVIPVPLQVPPPVAAVILNGAVFVQTGETAVIEVFEKVFTVTVAVLLEGHAPPIVYVIVNAPAPEVAGLNVPFAAFVIPVPLHVPPPVAAVMLNGTVLVQTGETGVIIVLGTAFTVTVVVLLEGQAPPIVYVMVNAPAPAVAGLNVPFAALVIPVPLHVPPPVAALMLKGAALEQTGETDVIVVFGTAFTVTVAVLLEGQAPPIVYVIVNAPAPEVAGLNVPFAAFVIPVPLHVPPPVAALILNGAVFVQTGDTAVMVVLGTAFTVTVVVLLEGQAPPIVYVIVKAPAPAVAGLNVPFAALVIPVPLHVPPPVAALKLKGAAFVQTGETAVIAVLGTAFTVTVVVVLDAQAPLKA